jgi:hypothetical protein
MCLPGTAAPESGATACERCAYQPSPGATACAECAQAWTAPDATGTRCVCAPGARLDVGGIECVPCPAQTYETERMCAVCPPWQATAPDAVGATACDRCAPGATTQRRDDDETECRPIEQCPAGTYVRMDGAGCGACPAHMTTYVVDAPGCACAPDTELTAAGRCVPCAPGTWGAIYGACAPCPVGTFRGDVGLSPPHCLDCAAGTYASAPGASACDACAAGAYRAEEEEEGDGCALCAPGTFASMAGAEACAACAPGSYAPAEGAAACVACAEGSAASFLKV